jgi:DNA-binding NarL/FixJ family response regulator
MRTDHLAPVRVFIADDHPIVRQGLRVSIDAEPSMTVVAEAADGAQALETIRATKPDIAVLDIDMPGTDGFMVARTIRNEGLAVAIIFLTVHREEDFFAEALNLGARGYVLKDSAATDIVAGIKAVAAGEHYTSPAMTTALVQRTRRVADRGARPPSIDDLTPTERRILKLIGEYKTSREIADELCVSARTVDTHRTNICTKLEIRGSHGLMKFALTHRAEL